MARIAAIKVPGLSFNVGPFNAVRFGACDYEVAVAEADSADDIAAAVSAVRRRQAREVEAALAEATAFLARLPQQPAQQGQRPYRDYKTGPHVKPDGSAFTPGANVAIAARRCRNCERALTSEGFDYSMRKHGEAFCIDHDPARRGGR